MTQKNGSVFQVEGLSYSYGNGKAALRSISFDLQKGRVTALLGPNGAGKSTLFSIATALISAQEGRLCIDGVDISKQTRSALARIGVVFQQTTLDLDLTVVQNLKYAASLHGLARKETNERIEKELTRLDMFERRHEKVRQLNGGHKRRVEIARALLHKPEILLLDEATVGLDVPTRKNIVEHVHQLCRDDNIAVLWATHLIDEIAMGDDVVILHQGEIKTTNSVEQLCGEYGSVEAAFVNFTQDKGAL
ncbi:ABC transporter ATP-binding protein [Terasakiella sp. SH-1]|uniref:ABC transporter ATP-binding protein n=1 Tax=Terasakiella sp. SH-1 TaxID=2560057 RepID=UPI0010733ACA|nr:ABC transporter ATP-binding protein [Terasakiella sp. SH-1]